MFFFEFCDSKILKKIMKSDNTEKKRKIFFMYNEVFHLLIQFNKNQSISQLKSDKDRLINF